MEVEPVFAAGERRCNSPMPRPLMRPSSLAVSGALFPSCGSPATTLYTLGCASPPVRQRVRFTASYELVADDSAYSQHGDIDLSHADVSLTRSNLRSLSAADVHGAFTLPAGVI